MKTRNIKIAVVAAGLAMFSACSDDFLNTNMNGVITEANFYQNETQAFQGVVAVYDILKKESGGFENMIAMFNAGSDDHYAGGGSATDGAGIQGFSNYSINSGSIPKSFWGDYYQGIFRANVLLQKLPGVTMDDAKKARFAAETKALRAYYFFQLVRMFGDVPLILEPVAASEYYNVTRTPKAEVYAQIEKDLLEAIPSLPGTIPTEENGRLTKGAAQAILGKAYLYEGKNAEAAAQFAEVNGTPGQPNQYGNRLLTNFADLWVVDNKFNSESILEATHTSESHADWGFWGSGADEGNSLNQMVGPRGYNRLSPTVPDFNSGWSFNVITQGLYDVMSGDPRFAATIADLKAWKQAGLIDYNASGTYQDTGYYLRKFMPLNSDKTTSTGATELNFRQDTYVIRLADTYLMEAEALGATGARAQALLDAVRARVGLASIPVSMTAIKLERRKELAGEGHRWFDLVRWGDAPTALAFKNFTPGKNEVLPIPFTETDGTKITQNPNY
jgi:starch-binding outer membrane protein, SusD/RagB family